MRARLFTFTSTVCRMHEGPLGPYVDGFGAFLQERGHPLSAVRDRIRLVADLSRWLDRRGLAVNKLTRQTLSDFLRGRCRRFPKRRGERERLGVFCEHLRRIGVLGLESPPGMAAPRHPLEVDFTDYLQKRGLARATLINYLPFVRELLARHPDSPQSTLRSEAVVRFVLRRVRSLNPGRAKLLVTALRAFFRFLRLRGDISTDLAACVPTVPDWRLTTLPKSLRPEEVRSVLEACDTNRPAGRRDYAILLLLARLGLRAGEIVSLELEDLDWEAGEIIVRGKGSQSHRLPLPREVGKALVAYLTHARPKRCASRRVFVRTFPPFTGFASSVAVCTLVRRALLRTGLHPPRTGAHLFRHALACQMLRRGATLSEIGEVLRHRHPDTTAIYAKVDIDRLRPLAQKWPGGKP
jgi:site-specific recombinase XerD